MKSYELVKKTILGENNTGITPVYAWVRANMDSQISQAFGSVENFEDHYHFDMHHLFGGPQPFDAETIMGRRAAGEEITPEVMLDIPLMPTDRMEDYAAVIKDLDFHKKQRDRFCYMQTFGIFECLNGALGIEDNLCYMAMYPDEIKEVYRRQAQWNKQVTSNMMDLGVDMIHISDDWGAQRSLMFSKSMFNELVMPNIKIIAQEVKKRGVFLSLHSDGCIKDVVDDICDMGFDVVHPWQETAGMDYDLYLNKYHDKFAILGGLCVQSTLGFGNLPRLKSEIERVFSLLKGKRWICCTTHYVQDHCSIEELIFAMDLVTKLAGK